MDLRTRTAANAGAAVATAATGATLARAQAIRSSVQSVAHPGPPRTQPQQQQQQQQQTRPYTVAADRRRLEHAPAPVSFGQVAPGTYTVCIYALIRDGRYAEAIQILLPELATAPGSRPALSLLAYCYYAIQDWATASSFYEELTRLHPEVEEYKLYCAAALHKAGQDASALRVLNTLPEDTDPSVTDAARRLGTAILYNADELPACQVMLKQCAAATAAAAARGPTAKHVARLITASTRTRAEANTTSDYDVDPTSVFNKFKTNNMISKTKDTTVTVDQQQKTQANGKGDQVGDINKVDQAEREEEEEEDEEDEEEEEKEDLDDDLYLLFNRACLLYKMGQFADAAAKFKLYQRRAGGVFDPEASYYAALCHYQMREYSSSLRLVADVIECGIRDFPDLNVGVTPGDILSVGNTPALHKSRLVEAFNLKAAIELLLGNPSAAKEAMRDMPPRVEEELDPVTLHNQALVYADVDPAASFEKLVFLLQLYSCPPETFGNLLLLYLRYEFYDLAADLLAENESIARFVLSKYLYEFLNAVLLRTSSFEDSFKALEDLSSSHSNVLRDLCRAITEAKASRDEISLHACTKEFNAALELYIPILMSQAKLYWDKKEYSVVERIFRKSIEFCSSHDVWKLNVAHVLFMQENKYKEAASFYEPYVRARTTKHVTSPSSASSVCSNSTSFSNSALESNIKLLKVPAIVLANLSVCYLMTHQNDSAQELMTRLEAEETMLGGADPTAPRYHVCIVNLVIGTLYCCKGNFEFGVDRVIRSMQPINTKLSTDTWYYSSRCLCALYETMAKQLILLSDDLFVNILTFLSSCDAHGREIPAVSDPVAAAAIDPARNTVSYEARYLMSLFIKNAFT